MTHLVICYSFPFYYREKKPVLLEFFSQGGKSDVFMTLFGQGHQLLLCLIVYFYWFVQQNMFIKTTTVNEIGLFNLNAVVHFEFFFQLKTWIYRLNSKWCLQDGKKYCSLILSKGDFQDLLIFRPLLVQYLSSYRKATLLPLGMK